jgi:hypothetical protein
VALSGIFATRKYSGFQLVVNQEALLISLNENRFHYRRRRLKGRRFDTQIMTHLMNFENINSIEDLEQVSKEAIWQNFERLVGFIFEMNDFQVNINRVMTFNKNAGNTMLSPRIMKKYT